MTGVVETESHPFNASALAMNLLLVSFGLYLLIGLPSSVNRRIENGELEPEVAANVVWIRVTGAMIVAACVFELVWRLWLRGVVSPATGDSFKPAGP